MYRICGSHALVLPFRSRHAFLHAYQQNQKKLPSPQPIRITTFDWSPFYGKVISLDIGITVWKLKTKR